MSSIDLLEQRVTELEDRIFGTKKKFSQDDPAPENSIIDELLHVNTLVSSTLSGREKINGLIKRLPELNDMLDSSYEAIDIRNEAKMELLLAMEPEIRAYADSIQRLEVLSPALNLDHMRDIPELLVKLNILTLSYVEYHQESEHLARNVWSLFTEYNNIVTSIAKTLIGINAAVTAAEAATLPKKQLD